MEKILSFAFESAKPGSTDSPVAGQNSAPFGIYKLPIDHDLHKFHCPAWKITWGSRQTRDFSPFSEQFHCLIFMEGTPKFYLGNCPTCLGRLSSFQALPLLLKRCQLPTLRAPESHGYHGVHEKSRRSLGEWGQLFFFQIFVDGKLELGQTW